MVCGCTYIVYSLCESCRLFSHRRLVARISGRCTPAMPSDLAIFPTGGFGQPVGSPTPRPASRNFRNAIGLCHFSDWRFRPVGSPTPQTRPTKLPQCHPTLPFFQQAVSAGRLHDPPRPAPPNFRNAIGLCHFSDWRFRPVGSTTPPDPPHQTSAMPSDFAIFPTAAFDRSPQTPPPPSPNFCNAIRLPTGHLSLSQCHYFRRRPYLGNGSSERPAM